MKKTLLFIPMILAIFSSSAQNNNNPGGTVTTCSGKFNDTGGPAANYGNNESIVTTLCSATPGNCIKVSSWDFNLGKGDTLRIYDGTDVSSRLIGAYTDITDPGPIVSSKGCLTFKFTSDTAVTGAGWEASISCTSTCAPVVAIIGDTTNFCSGKFYDSGGDKNYGNNEHSVTTLCSDSVEKKIQLTFSDFGLDAGDFFYVYDGPSTSAALLDSYSNANSPYKITSTGQCVTLEFISDSSITDLGWDVNVSCISTVSVPELSAASSFDFILQNNPATSQLIGELYSFENAAFTVDIMDLQGRLVSSKKMKASTGPNSVVVDLDALEKGLYIIRINNASNSIQKKFLKL